ncbi:MAG: enoyl-CoA hydratase/isomerase family protein [Candidatus Hydrogenedentes bacterium]|nr:enoyl-CoA hydratase/isomerase family protein [Candidatus Hydrogenedentota bacterium]
MSDPVMLSIEGPIARIVFNRPEVYNALDGPLLHLLSDRCMEVATDPKVRAVILTGAGKAFCSGADLRMLIANPEQIESSLYTLAAVLHQAVLEIRRMRKPVLAAISGVAAGAGLALALACDFRVMAKNAILKQAYTSWGLCMDGGSTFMLPRLIGLARALEVAGMDAPITSEQALAWGLVTRIADDDRIMDEAQAMAAALAERSQHGFGLVKQLLTDSFHTPLEVQLEHERAAITACGTHPDGREGMAAFASKRKPVFHREA